MTAHVSLTTLFRVDRNKPFSETELIATVVESLRAHLPSTWTLRVEADVAWPLNPDAVLTVTAPDGTNATIVAEAKVHASMPMWTIAGQLQRYTEACPQARPLAIAPYFGRTAREQLERAGIGYADATGNIRIAIDVPALFIETHGADRDPWPDDRPLRSLRGAGAGRAIRALCDFAPPYGTRQLAERARVPAPTLSRVAELLERESILRRERARGPIVAVDWQLALRRWSEDYAFTRSNKTSSWLEPRGLSTFISKLRDSGLRYAITGSLAAYTVAPITAPRLVTVYVENVTAAAASLGLRRAESGANVLLAEPFDAVAFERGFEREETRYAACSQVAIDLMTGPGRSPAEAEALMHWMEAHERTWRA